MAPNTEMLKKIRAQVPLFNGMADSDIEICVSRAKWFRPKPDEIVIKERDPGKQLYVIFSGHVEVYRDVDNQYVKIAELGPGDTFGEMVFLDRTRRSASVKALTHCTLMSLAPADLLYLEGAMPKFYKNLACLMASRLHSANTALAAACRVNGGNLHEPEEDIPVVDAVADIDTGTFRY